jgi:hypothetical protein
MLIDDRAPPPPSRGDRAPIEPNWRAIGWCAAAVVLFFAASEASGLAVFLIVCATMYAACRAGVELIGYADGLRDWRQ